MPLMLAAGMAQMLFVGYSIPGMTRQSQVQIETAPVQAFPARDEEEGVIVLEPDPIPLVLRSAEAWSQATHTYVARALLREQ
jgi:hypothetical protein